MKSQKYFTRTCAALIIVGFLASCSTAQTTEDENARPTSNCTPKLDEKGKPDPRNPDIYAVIPPEAKRTGQTDITISGKNFVAGAIVLLGNSACNAVQVVDSKTIRCTTPKHKPEVVDITVHNPDETCALHKDGFAFIPSVVISPQNKILSVGNTFTFDVLSGKPPYSFTLLSGEGAINKETGEFTAPGQPGTSVIRVTDLTGTQAEAIISTTAGLVISGPKFIMPSGKYNFSANGGVPPFQFLVSSGPGSIDPTTGIFSADGAANESVIVRVEDSMGNHAESSFTIQSPFVFSPPGDQICIKNKVSITGGLEPVRSIIMSGGGTILEDGITYQSSDSPGTAVVRVMDGQGNQVDKAYTVLPSPVIFPYAKSIVVGDTIQFTITGGVPPIVYSIQNGKGLIDAKTGKFTAPETPEEITVRATDAVGNFSDAAITVHTDGVTLQKIAAGYNHSCAVWKGAAKCWGSNVDGQLGNGTNRRKFLPTVVDGLKEGVIAVTSGFHHSCALIRGGIIKCWGENSFGQLGNNSVEASNIPVRVYGITAGAQAIVAGEYHTCAIVNGAALCWGDNRRGQLGNNSQIPSSIPVQVKGLNQAVQSLAVGSYHTCAITAGSLKCWGYNYAGQLGDGTQQTRFEAVQVTGLEQDVQLVSAGGFHTCALASNKMKCWGYNGSGQLGVGTKKNSNMPLEVQGLAEKPSTLALGHAHSCVIAGGKTYCWGYNAQAQIGDPDLRQQYSSPVLAPLAQDAPEGLSAGVAQTCTIKGDNAVCWGSNGLGDKYTEHPIELKDFTASFPETQ